MRIQLEVHERFLTGLADIAESECRSVRQQLQHILNKGLELAVYEQADAFEARLEASIGGMCVRRETDGQESE